MDLMWTFMSSQFDFTIDERWLPGVVVNDSARMELSEVVFNFGYSHSTFIQSRITLQGISKAIS
jgi:hypothetical protein